MMRFISIALAVCLLCTLVAQSASQKCPSQTLNEMSGEFQSAGYPDTPYPNKQRCRFNIKAPKGYYVEIVFTDFEMETLNLRGRKRDFVRAIDGPGRKPVKVEHYTGTMETPFTFVTSTNRASLVFVTNNSRRMKGFHAVYRMRKIIEAVYCEYPELENGYAEICEEAPEDPDFFSKCSITCDFGFERSGNENAVCDTETGNWTELPSCVLNPEVLEICLNNITNLECLYSPEILTNFLFGNIVVSEFDDEEITGVLEEFGDDIGEMEEIDEPGVSRSQGQKVSCDKRLCAFDKKNNKFAVSCKLYSAAVAKKKGFGPKKAKAVLLHCFSCQSSGCVPVSIFR